MTLWLGTPQLLAILSVLATALAVGYLLWATRDKDKVWHAKRTYKSKSGH